MILDLEGRRAVVKEAAVDWDMEFAQALQRFRCRGNHNRQDRKVWKLPQK